jgi:hypothetical protein
MRMSPRLRRLRSDQKAMEQLRAESQILDYTAPGPMFGGPPESYGVRFRGLGLWSPDGSQEVLIRDEHEVLIRLGASYPRMMPELIWKTPIFHPNISANGVVCLGGYSTHWVPSLQLDELCTMLWDMIRYENFDVDSPYNRAAAQWAKEQSVYDLPIDRRTLRDNAPVLPGDPAVEAVLRTDPSAPAWLSAADVLPDEPARAVSLTASEIVFVDDEVIEAEIVESDMSSCAGAEILFIE